MKTAFADRRSHPSRWAYVFLAALCLLAGCKPLTTRYSYTSPTNTPTGEPVVHAGDILLNPLAK